MGEAFFAAKSPQARGTDKKGTKLRGVIYNCTKKDTNRLN